MSSLPEVTQVFVADVSRYSRRVREAANDADKFGERNDRAALAARKMGLASKEAAEKAAQAQKAAADAAEKLARGELKAEEAAQIEAKALREAERAAIKLAEAEMAAGKAADSAAKNLKQMGRDASLAAAATHLAALREVGDSKSYNEALTRLKKTHGDLSKTALASFKTMENDGSSAYKALTAAGESFGKAGPLMIVPAANAIANLPAIASVAAGGVTLALGGALSGIGIMAQARTADVKRTFSAMSKDVGHELTQISTPFHDTLLHISADAGNAFHQLAPSLQGAFAEMAPAVTRFSSTLASGLSGPRMQAAITSIGTGFSKVLDSLGPATSTALGDIADGVKSISDAAAQNPQALSGLVTGIGQITKYTGEGIGALVKYKTEVDGVVHAVAGMGPGGLFKFVGTLKDGTQALLGTSHGLQIAGGSFPTFEQKAITAAAATGHLMTAQQAAALSSQQLKVSIDNLTSGFSSGFDAETQYQRALISANAQAKANSYGIDTNTSAYRHHKAAVLANRDALSTLEKSIKHVMETSHPTAAAIEGMRQKFVNAAVGMGKSRGAAEALANKLLGVTRAANTIPSNKNGPKFHDNALTVRGHIGALQASINQLHGKTVTVDYIERVHRTLQAERARATGGYVGLAEGGMPRRRYPVGGPVAGPGTSTSDSIPAMLSNGEYVINAEQTSKYLPLLDAINYKLDGFAKGGKAPKPHPKPLTKAQKAGQARVAHARARPEYLAAMAAQHSLESMRRTMYGGMFRGGKSTPGSAHGSVVQHITTINVNVAGSIRSDQDIAKIVQRQLLTNRMPVTLPSGR